MLTPNQLQLQLGQGYKCKWLNKPRPNSKIQVSTPLTLPDGTAIDVYVTEISQQRNEGVLLSDLGETAGWLWVNNQEDFEETEYSPAIWTELKPKHLHLPNSGIPSSEELHLAIPMFVDNIQNFVNHVLAKLEEKRKENGKQV
jgi:hypothetical protein